MTKRDVTNTIILASLAAGLALPAMGQTLPPTNAGVGDFTVENPIPLSGLSAPAAPKVPADVLAALGAGTLQARQRFTYSAAQQTLQEVSFIVPGTTAFPTPSLDGAIMNDRYSIKVDRAVVLSAPVPTVVVSGRAVSNEAVTPFGNSTGALYTLSFGFQGSGTSAKVTGPVFETAAGLYSIYSPIASGTVNLQDGSIAVTDLQPTNCSAATLRGAYVFQIAGSIYDGTIYRPYVDSGRVFFDGQGKGTIVDSANFGAQQVATARSFPLTYVLDSGCSGYFTFSGGGMDVTATTDGGEIRFVFTSPTTITAQGFGRKQ